jgi:hypothetical protein
VTERLFDLARHRRIENYLLIGKPIGVVLLPE